MVVSLEPRSQSRVERRRTTMVRGPGQYRCASCPADASAENEPGADEHRVGLLDACHQHGEIHIRRSLFQGKQRGSRCQ